MHAGCEQPPVAAEGGSTDEALKWKALECLGRGAVRPDEDQPAAQTADRKPTAGRIDGHVRQHRRFARGEQRARLLAGKQRDRTDCLIAHERDEPTSVGRKQHRVRWGRRTDHAPTRHRDGPECRFGPVRGYQPLPGRVEVIGA